jgi:integrase
MDGSQTTGRREARSRKKKRRIKAETDTMRGIAAVTLSDGTVRYRASIPGGRRGARTWTQLVPTAETAAELRKNVLQKMESRPALTMTFEAAIKATKEDFEKRCRPATAKWFEFQEPALKEHFGRMLVSCVTPQDVERFAARQIASKVSPGTVLHRRRGLRAVLSFARDQLVNGDPMTSVRRGTWPKLRKGKVTAPEPETVRKFLTAIIEAETKRSNDRTREDHDLVAALFLTGLRRSELARLRAEDLRPDEGRVFVQGKVRD